MPLGDLLQTSSSKSVLNKLNYACESVPFLSKLFKTLLKLNFFTLQLKLLHAITKCCKINWRIEGTKTCGSKFLLQR